MLQHILGPSHRLAIRRIDHLLILEWKVMNSIVVSIDQGTVEYPMRWIVVLLYMSELVDYVDKPDMIGVDVQIVIKIKWTIVLGSKISRCKRGG